MSNYLPLPEKVPSDRDGEGLGGRGAGADGIGSEALALEDAEELVAGGQGPGVGPVSHQQQPQRLQADVLVVLGRQQPPVKVSGLHDGYAGCQAISGVISYL